MSNIEQTLSIIKPDAVERNLDNEIKEIFKNKGFSILKEKPEIEKKLKKTEVIKPEIQEKKFYKNNISDISHASPKVRKFFEVDKEHLVTYGLSILAKEQLITSKYAKDAIKKYNIDSNKPMPTKL